MLMTTLYIYTYSGGINDKTLEMISNKMNRNRCQLVDAFISVTKRLICVFSSSWFLDGHTVAFQ